MAFRISGSLPKQRAVQLRTQEDAVHRSRAWEEVVDFIGNAVSCIRARRVAAAVTLKISMQLLMMCVQVL